MGWLGKVIGGTFGFMLGGPLGMIAGASFGHLFDASGQGVSQDQKAFWYQGNRQQGRVETQEQTQMVFFVAAFSMLAKITTADGTVTEAERRKVVEFINRDLRLQGQAQQAAMRIFETAQRSPESFEQFAVQFYDVFKQNRQMLNVMMDIFYRVSYADGNLSSAEEQLIRKAGDLFHFLDEQMEAIRKRYGAHESSSHAYHVLGVSSGSSNDEVKSAYRKLVSEYHPDKIASKGLPDEFIKFANEKFREIQSAYEEIRTSRGI
jgi:DnaJ like chaperone protein